MHIRKTIHCLFRNAILILEGRRFECLNDEIFRRSPKLDISKQSPRDDKLYTNTDMYRNAVHDNELYD